MKIKHIFFTLLLAFGVLCNVACSDSDNGAENSTLKELLCANKWYVFSDSEYYIYTFDSQNQLTISSYVLKDNYENQTLTYSCSGDKIIAKTQFDTIKEYQLLESNDHYLKMMYNNKTLILYRELSRQELENRLSGTWENNEIWYTCYTFNSDNTYVFEQIINHTYDEEESGPGSYRFYDDIWIELSPNNTILPKVNCIIYFDEDWNLVLISQYNNSSSVYHKITSQEESCRPELTTDSPYYNEINGSTWLLFGKSYDRDDTNGYMRGFEMLEFSGLSCTRSCVFKNKEYYTEPYSRKFSIDGNTITLSSYSSLSIDVLDNGKLSLSHSSDVYTRYDDDYIKSFVGKWSVEDLVLVLRSDGTYTMDVYDSNQQVNVEESFNGTYSIEPGFITIDPMPYGFGNPSGYFHYTTDFDNGKMFWYNPTSTWFSGTQWEKVDN